MRKKFQQLLKGIGVGMALLTLIMFSAPVAQAQTNEAPLPATTLSVGDQNQTVARVQELLSTEPILYPEGLVTGYYGPLTKAAVEQFQLQYGLATDGIVGPNTRKMMNTAIAYDVGIDIRVPMMNATLRSTTDTSATVDVHTQTPTRVYAYFDTKPITGRDAKEPFVLPEVSGVLSMDPNLSTDHTITFPNLIPEATYYSVVLTQDASGNVAAEYLPAFTAH